MSSTINNDRLHLDALEAQEHAEYMADPSSPTHEDHERRIATVLPSIQLITGRIFDFTEPTPLTIFEASAALSKICRFTGHCTEFYSVAQHSLLVSMLVPHHLALQGLLHDVAEAVLSDMSGPLKKLMPEFKALERKTEQVILAGFNLPAELDPLVKRADLVALKLEREAIMGKSAMPWNCLDGIETNLVEVAHLDWVRSLSIPQADFWFVKTFMNLTTRG